MAKNTMDFPNKITLLRKKGIRIEYVNVVFVGSAVRVMINFSNSTDDAVRFNIVVNAYTSEYVYSGSTVKLVNPSTRGGKNEIASYDIVAMTSIPYEEIQEFEIHFVQIDSRGNEVETSDNLSIGVDPHQKQSWIMEDSIGNESNDDEQDITSVDIDDLDDSWINNVPSLDDGIEDDIVHDSSEDSRKGVSATDYEDIEPDEDESDDEFNEDWERDESVEATGVDNSEHSYKFKRISVVLNINEEERRNRLSQSTTILSQKYQAIREMVAENKLQILLDACFPDGLQKHFYLRNLTLDENTEYRVCAIRPVRMPEDELSEYIPESETLLFKGHVRGKQFIVDCIYDMADSDRLPFEVDCTASQYKDPTQIHENFLFDVCENTESITQYTKEQLEEWKQYLDWRKGITKKQIVGCKYFRREYDPERNQIVFYLVCQSQEVFQNFRRYLRRGIEAFNNNYSTDRWSFVAAEYDPKKRFESKELGKFVGIRNEYYLKGSYMDSDYVHHAQDGLLDQDELANGIDDDDFDEEDEASDSSEISEIFDNPYVAEVAFEVKNDSNDSVDIEAEEGMANDTIVSLIGQRVANSYFPDGFLALSAVGDYVLINRFRRAISQLEQEEYYSPNLTTWLFNARLARLPSEDSVNITKWLNQDVASNANQTEAITKMLLAPDLCLIQGPPGTGKTTVIAEAIYQFVRNGNRVLIASQSNDAVDNALERLAETPEIRAIRMGRRAKKGRKAEEDVTEKYAEKEALWYYYSSLSNQIHDTWLDSWANMDQKVDEYNADIQAVTINQREITEYNNRRNEENIKQINKTKEIQRKRQEVRYYSEQNESIIQLQRNYELFIGAQNGETDEQFYLSYDIIATIKAEINNMIYYAQSNGACLSRFTIEGVEETASLDNSRIATVIQAVSSLKGLIIRCTKSSPLTDDQSGNEEVFMLQRKIDALQDQVFQEDDEERAYELLREIRKYKAELEKAKSGNSSVALTRLERTILSQKMCEKFQSGNFNDALQAINSIISKWNDCISSINTYIFDYIDRQQPKDISQLEEEVNVLDGQLTVIRSELARINDKIDAASFVLRTLREKYSITDDKPESIIKKIRSLQEENNAKLLEHKQIRSDWEDTLHGFVDRLTDREAYPHDYEQFNSTFVRSCNVIGISCTGDMRSLQENGQNDFDVVIIDEVSKATPPELLIPLMRARKTILVGDHRQLPPMFKEHEASYKEMIQQQEEDPEEENALFTMANFKRFERMVTASLFKEFFETADNSIKHSLLTQYRMHTDIMNIINRFYSNRLEQGLSEKQLVEKKSHGLTIKGIDGSSFIMPQRHAYWIDSSYLPSGVPIYDSQKEGSTSSFNCFEVEIIIELLKKIADAYAQQGYTKEKPKDVGVISFYQSQINELRGRFREEKKYFDFSSISVDINTVDRFQGKEKSIIITSLVRNNRRGMASKHVATFERINVAFSRAQQLLLIVGAKNLYDNIIVDLPNMDRAGSNKIKVYNQILQELSIKGCYKTSEKIITPEIEELVKQKYAEAGGRL